MEVESLAILNTPAPLAPPPAAAADQGQVRWILAISRPCEEVTGKRVPIGVSDLISLDDAAQLHALRSAMISAGLLLAEAQLNQIRGLLNVFRANSSARYRSDESLDISITLLRATEVHPQFDFSSAEDPGVNLAQSTLGWKWLAKRPVAVHTVPGNHLTMLNAPNIDAIAKVLRLAYCKEEFYAWESE